MSWHRSSLHQNPTTRSPAPPKSERKKERDGQLMLLFEMIGTISAVLAPVDSVAHETGSRELAHGESLSSSRDLTPNLNIPSSNLAIDSGLAWLQTNNDPPIRLPAAFKLNRPENIAIDNRPFLLELLLFQLETALMASEEVSYNTLDSLNNGTGNHCRELIADFFFETAKSSSTMCRPYNSNFL
ncbi:uncharacterized protein BDR25DRAFT_355495 [Lindgomyces ingoldianus]|uniref:Uncharacterized protein n=1 Tax=Lindgomyces ingoldianus TaxID=673940 RepID=A0ACB6QTQ5_9PLEO|nr:uncharacterized protein BDR25DRAFT_355495 [Lindgomyces ingoldianus]KAF2470384.1 hypothetical protein BDR25DRAFT_355495 [Lindgomyces ingoldianus]